VANTLTLLEAGVNQITFSSSCTTYGIPETVPITEDHPQQPINPYGFSKLMVEQILADFHLAYGLNYVCFRYFNAAGADPEGQIGEDHTPETHLIPIVLQTALGKKDAVQIFGTDYPTPDGTCIRDFIHVSDLADAHLLGLNYLMQGGESTVFIP
jgi:UDP-glucose 4-epimerase